MKNRIGIIDLGINNMRSLINLFDLLNTDYEIVTRADSLKNFNKIVLPGVGSFSPAMKKINESDFKNQLLDSINNKIPILGICLGMQLFFETSEEGEEKGLGLVHGNVKILDIENNYTLPHIGWNEVNYSESKINIFDKIENNSNFYFANSYSVHISNDENIEEKAFTSHGGKYFLSAFQKENIYGVQFHPEKSQKVGTLLLKNFINL